MKKISFFTISVLLLLYSCSSKKETLSENQIGSFVYIDQYKCLHVNNRCIKLMFGDEGERPNYMVTRVPVTELQYFERTCASCVSDEIYRDLSEIVESNHKEDRDSISVD